MKYLFLFFTCVFFVLCNNQVDKNNSEKIQNIHSVLKPGTYGDLSVAVNNNLITGIYEYYDKWDESYKEFSNINVFYFSGELINNKVIITGGMPGIDNFSGILQVNPDSSIVRIILDNQPSGYANLDFEENGYSSMLTEEKTWKEIRIVKSERAYFYNSSLLGNKLDTYVIKNDFVKVLEKKSDYCYVEFYHPYDKLKITNGWIKESDLFNYNPKKW